MGDSGSDRMYGLAQSDRVQRLYRCAGGLEVRVVYQNPFDRVGVAFNSQTYGPLYQVAAASGVKYSNGRASWWIKGSGASEEAMLMSERNGRILVQGCRPLR